MSVPMRKLREITFQMLYSYDIAKAPDEEMLQLLTSELKVTKKTVKEIQEKVHLIWSRLPDIDALIAKISKSYEFERIQSVERNILRLSTFELLYDPSVPPKVSIAEAKRLAQKFTTKEAAAFINAILDEVHRSSIGEKADHDKIREVSCDLLKIEEISILASTDPANN